MGEANRRGSYESREVKEKKRQEYVGAQLKYYQTLSHEKRTKLLELIAVEHLIFGSDFIKFL